ncbi:zonular occludens toxin domain-containing protein [Cellvibrio sp. UBA7661]|uniref:zonular occludens toxin domain-containing protein n=1 Tax=Cellvibrio sp. UBA7661 TaxID=1946311 RepID=UPI002F35B984
MIYLFTGAPGSSKTLNVIKTICEDSTFKGRNIYYHRIKELSLPWISLDENEVKEWDTLPEGAVLVVDEAQYLMPVRDPRKPLPDWILKMSEHRHKGYDLIFMTQSPNLLDAGFRRFVGRHTHIERIFGLESAKWLTWEKCVTDVDDHFKRKEAVIKRVGFDKKYYGTYKSAEVHTHKRKLPAKVFIPFIALAVLIGLVVHFVNSWGDRIDSESLPDSIAAPVEKLAGVIRSDSPSSSATYLSTDDYIKAHTPRLPDVPWSAPVYDALTVPKTFPRPQCIRFNRGYDNPPLCKCYTQQATPLEISEKACNRYVDNGYFNHTKPDNFSDSQGGDYATARDQGLPRALAGTANVPVTR